MSTMRQDLLKLRRLKREETFLYEKHKSASEARKNHERHVLDRMEMEGVEGQKADDSTFTPIRTVYGSVQDREVFATWAQEHEPDLLRPQDPRQRELNTLVRRLLDDGEPLPPGVGFYTKEYVSVRDA